MELIIAFVSTAFCPLRALARRGFLAVLSLPANRAVFATLFVIIVVNSPTNALASVSRRIVDPLVNSRNARIIIVYILP